MLVSILFSLILLTCNFSHSLCLSVGLSVSLSLCIDTWMDSSDIHIQEEIYIYIYKKNIYRHIFSKMQFTKVNVSNFNK